MVTWKVDQLVKDDVNGGENISAAKLLSGLQVYIIFGGFFENDLCGLGGQEGVWGGDQGGGTAENVPTGGHGLHTAGVSDCHDCSRRTERKTRRCPGCSEIENPNSFDF